MHLYKVINTGFRPLQGKGIAPFPLLPIPHGWAHVSPHLQTQHCTDQLIHLFIPSVIHSVNLHWMLSEGQVMESKTKAQDSVFKELREDREH